MQVCPERAECPGNLSGGSGRDGEVLNEATEPGFRVEASKVSVHAPVEDCHGGNTQWTAFRKPRVGGVGIAELAVNREAPPES